MENDKPNNLISNSRENQISAVRKQLLSPKLSNVRQGIEQTRQWLLDNPEDQETYKLLLDVFDVGEENSSLQEEIRNILQGLSEKGFSFATKALNDLNESTQTVLGEEKNTSRKETGEVQPLGERDLMAQADDAYYAAEFDKAIRLYRLVTQAEPNNERARQQLAKAELNRVAGPPSPKLPREAVKYYRQARSYIAAKDYKSAITFLNIAIETAQASQMKFPEAEIFLDITQDQMTASEYKEKAEAALLEEKWEASVEFYKMALRLDPTDEINRNLCNSLLNLFRAEALLETLAIQVGSDRISKLLIVAATLKEVEEIKYLVSAKRYKVILAKYNLYKAESDLHKWGWLTALAPHGYLQEAQSAAISILSSDDPSLKYTNMQIGRLRPLRVIFILILLLAGGLILVFTLNKMIGNTQPPITLTPNLAFTPTDIAFSSKTPLSTTTPTITATNTATLTAISTLPPTPILLDTGFVFVALMHPQDKPNGKWIGELRRYQVVNVLEKRVVSGDVWYFCQWEIDGTSQQGWILAQFVNIGPTRTPRPTTTP